MVALTRRSARLQRNRIIDSFESDNNSDIEAAVASFGPYFDPDPKSTSSDSVTPLESSTPKLSRCISSRKDESENPFQSGITLPKYNDLGLPPMNTSSGRVMRQNDDGGENDSKNLQKQKRRRVEMPDNEQERGRKEPRKVADDVSSMVALEDLIDKVDILVSEMYQKDRKIADCETAITDIQSKKNYVEAKNTDLTARIADLEGMIASLKEKNHQLRVNEDKAKRELQNRIADMESKKKFARANEDYFRELYVNLYGERDTLRERQWTSHEAATGVFKSLKEQFSKTQEIIDKAQRAMDEIL